MLNESSQGDTMKLTLFAVSLVSMLVRLAAGQDGIVPSPVTVRENAQAISARQGTEPAMRKGSSYEPPFCPPKTCLYYAGDYDSSDSNANGLFNADDEGGSSEGQVWVGVKPDRDVTVTGATFVQILTGDYTVVNPTPFAVQTGTKRGQAGKTVCSTSGNATLSLYQQFGNINTYSCTIKKLAKSCKLKKGKTYYVNLLPTFEDSYGYVVNVEDAKPKDHHGWKNDLNDCYFNGELLGNNYNYVTCNSQGIGKDGFSEFSIALTGKE
jgi:hypothetical protein